MQNNNLTRFDEGGLHHQNPLGGVPVGGNNTVEQGETKLKNYVYSNRIAIDENMTKEMNLPNYIKGKTFADASKAIDNKFKDRNDKHSLETKNVFLDRLKQAQEIVKQQEQQKAEQIAQSMQSNQQEVPDMMNGEVPQGMEEFVQQPEQNQMFMGGDFNIAEVGNITGGLSGLAGKSSPYLQTNQNKQEKGAEIASNITTTTADMFLPGSGQLLKASDSLFSGLAGNSDIGKGVASMISPLGTIKGIGSAIATGNISDIPVVNMFTKNSTANKNKTKELNNNALNYNKQFSDNNFAKGGYLTSKPSQYDGGGPLDEGTISDEDITNNLAYQFQRRSNNGIINAQTILGVKPDGDFGKNSKLALQEYQKNNNLSVDGKLEPNTYKAMGLNNRGVLPLETLKPVGTNVLKTNINIPLPNISTNSIINDQNQLKSQPDKKEDLPGSLFSRNVGKILKYAPVAMNAYQLAKLKKPAYTRLDRLTNKFKPEYVDEAQLQNIANNEMNNSVNSISQLGGSEGAVRNAILGASLNKTKALSNAYMDVSAQNRQTNIAGQQFNLGVDQANINQANQELDINDKNQAAYRNEKSKYIASIGTDLGSIGKEEVNKNQIAEAFGYSWDGKYMIDKKTGEKKTFEDVVNKSQKSYGGYLKMNKIGRK